MTQEQIKQAAREYAETQIIPQLGYTLTAYTSFLSGAEYRQSEIDELVKPNVCPVCMGKGIVLNGFYSEFGSTSSAISEKCRTCNGKGYIIC